MNQGTTEEAAPVIGHPGCEGQTASQTLSHAVRLYHKSKERVIELEAAVVALAAPLFNGSDYEFSPQFFIGVQHPANHVDVRMPVSPDFLRPLVEAALINERAAMERMDHKLNQARKALQSNL